ncbi:MAG: hypothetical protein FWD68_21870 [Alphaproteobacteria bacterium]|nr:hypothetical protein [Alphaproteobacteria bacterium]
MGDVGRAGSNNYSRFPTDSSASDEKEARHFQDVLQNLGDSGKAQYAAGDDVAEQDHSPGSAPSSWVDSSLFPQMTWKLYDLPQKKSEPEQNRGQEKTGSGQPSKSWTENLVDRLQDSVDVIKGEVRKGVAEGAKLADEYTPRSVKDSFNDLKGTASSVTEQIGKGINDGVAMVQENTPQAVKDVLSAGLDKARNFQRVVDGTKDWVGAKVKKAEAAVSGQVNDTRKWLRENGGNAGQQASDIIGFGAGVGGAVYDFGKGTVKMVNEAGNLVNPLEWQVSPERNQQRLEGLKNGVEGLGRIAALASPADWALNPKGNFLFARGLGKGIEDGISKAVSEDPAMAAGAAVGTVATFLIPFGAGARAANVAKDAAEIGTVAGRVARGGAKAAGLADDIATLEKGGTEIARAVDGASAAGDTARLGKGAEIAGGVKGTDQAAQASREATAAEDIKPPQLPNASDGPKPPQANQVAEGRRTPSPIVNDASKAEDTTTDGTLFSSSELSGVEPASRALIDAVEKKLHVAWATPGSDMERFLNMRGAEAANFGVEDIVLRPNPSKAAVLEEFLHTTQHKLGIIDRLGTCGLGSAETHVKDFMIRHQSMLRLDAEDVRRLQVLRDMGL